MKIPREIPSMRRTDNSLKEVMTNLCNQKNFRRVFLNQTIPVLSLFANQPTMVLLYFISCRTARSETREPWQIH